MKTLATHVTQFLIPLFEKACPEYVEGRGQGEICIMPQALKGEVSYVSSPNP
jgi:hypothetical protein